MPNPSFPYDSCFQDLIGKLHSEGRYRVFAELEREVGRFPIVHLHSADGSQREVVVWCSNDYLGMGHHPSVLSAMHRSLDSFGAGSGGTRNIAGNHNSIVCLEKELAELHDKEAALAFSSGYVANVTALSTLAKALPGCVVFSDSENHASMIQGIRGSRCRKYVFEHNDLAHLERLLKDVDKDLPKIVAFESVYSMSGDFGLIEEICGLAKAYGALTYLDETHGVGLYGHKGGGVAQERHLTDRVDVLQGGLGKGFGVVGGFVTGSSLVIDVIRSYGTGFIFTTSLPPVIAEGAIASLKHLKTSGEERTRHQENARALKEILSSAGLPMLHTPSHIVPLMVRHSGTCKAVSDYLLEQEDIYIQPINYPTVPAGTERLRITPTPLHTTEQMVSLRDALLRAWSVFDLPLEQFSKGVAVSRNNFCEQLS
ncbi:MAG: 5-aminolevulinate synthase [Bdellovibrionales bacterium]|nr:5-aminolevulinate synthase [Bdellovibrionales bacterium]